MARIAGVDLPKNKRIEIGLTYIYGIGRSTADEILAGTGVNPDVRVKDLSEEDVAKLRDYIDKHITVEGVRYCLYNPKYAAITAASASASRCRLVSLSSQLVARKLVW